MNGPHDTITGREDEAPGALTWEELADALAVGEIEGAARVRAEIEARAAADPRLAAELELYDELARLGEALLEDPEDALPLSEPTPTLSADDERLVERVVAASAARERRARLWGPLLGTLAAAGFALIAWTALRDQAPQQLVATAPAAPVVEPQAAAQPGAATPAPGDPVADPAPWVEVDGARTCFDRPDAKVCAEGGARLRWARPEALELTAGAITVAGHPGGPRVELPGGAVGEVDGEARVEVGPNLVVVIVLTGSAQVELSSGPQTLVAGERASWPRAGGGAVVVGAAEAPQAPPPPVEARAPAVAEPSAADLLARAQDLRAAGDRAGAMRAYRRLVALHGESSEAHAALPALAKLELGAGRARSALRHFERYLKTGGPTAMEARRGRVEALRALRRPAQERAAIESFLAKHPDSIHADVMRARLRELNARP